MSEPTQAQVRAAIVKFRDTACWLEEFEVICAAAERSLAPATPTPEWELNVWRSLARGWLENCSDHRGEQIESLAQLLQHTARAAAPPATQTGEVRKAVAAELGAHQKNLTEWQEDLVDRIVKRIEPFLASGA